MWRQVEEKKRDVAGMSGAHEVGIKLPHEEDVSINTAELTLQEAWDDKNMG
jgi:hypothetical protein